MQPLVEDVVSVNGHIESFLHCCTTGSQFRISIDSTVLVKLEGSDIPGLAIVSEIHWLEPEHRADLDADRRSGGIPYSPDDIKVYLRVTWLYRHHELQGSEDFRRRHSSLRCPAVLTNSRGKRIPDASNREVLLSSHVEANPIWPHSILHPVLVHFFETADADLSRLELPQPRGMRNSPDRQRASKGAPDAGLGLRPGFVCRRFYDVDTLKHVYDIRQAMGHLSASLRGQVERLLQATDSRLKEYWRPDDTRRDLTDAEALP